MTPTGVRLTENQGWLMQVEDMVVWLSTKGSNKKGRLVARVAPLAQVREWMLKGGDLQDAPWVLLSGEYSSEAQARKPVTLIIARILGAKSGRRIQPW